MQPLVQDGHVVAALHDLETVVVEAGKPGIGQPAGDAAVDRVEILRAVEGPVPEAAAGEADDRGWIDMPLLRRQGQRRDPPIGRIHDDRGTGRRTFRPLVPMHRRTQVLPVIVRTHRRIVRCPKLFARGAGGEFLVCQHGPLAELRRTLQRHAAKGIRIPDALQVRIAPRRPKLGAAVSLLRRCRRRDQYGGCRQKPSAKLASHASSFSAPDNPPRAGAATL